MLSFLYPLYKMFKRNPETILNKSITPYVEEDIDYDNDNSDLVPENLKLVIIISGKRKSGKDHLSTLIANYIGHENSHQLAILRIAGPIKKVFAKHNKLDFDRLLDTTTYKEKYRQEMVKWSEDYRNKNGWNFFLKMAIRDQRARKKPIWILNDARRVCDIEFFDDDLFSKATILKIRIEASDQIRAERNWEFTPGIDDQETECGLDDYKEWTHIILNNSNEDKVSLKESLKPVFDQIEKALDSGT